MSISIVEGRLELQFAKGWSAIRWDAARPDDDPPYVYADGIAKLNGTLDGRPEGTKAVDVVAFGPKGQLCLIEIKDFRPARAGAHQHPPAANIADRWRTLPLECALKVRDTLAGLVGVINKGAPQSVAEWPLKIAPSSVRVAAFVLVENAQNRVHGKETTQTRELKKRLRAMCDWLASQQGSVVALDPLHETMPLWLDGLSVKSL